MTSNDLRRCLDLRRADSDPELFAAAIAIHFIRRLIAAGGGSIERPDEEEALSPYHLESFLARAVDNSHKTGRFEQEWCRLHRLMPQIQAAWERGQALFQEDLARAIVHSEEMEYLSHIDFAEDCYAAVDARRTYPHNRVLQGWATNGYMLAWWQNFLADDETPSQRAGVTTW